MNAPKLPIKPKATPPARQTEPPDRDVPVHGEWDPPVFTERDGEKEPKADEGASYNEDDCL